MPFAFSLRSVLAVRRRREEAEERLLARLYADLAAARQSLESVEAELCRLAEERDGEPPRRLQASDLHERYAHVSLFKQGRDGMLQHVADLGNRLQEQQRSYLHARRQREVLEELESGQRAAYTAARARAETKRNEDAFLSRYTRR